MGRRPSSIPALGGDVPFRALVNHSRNRAQLTPFRWHRQTARQTPYCIFNRRWHDAREAETQLRFTSRIRIERITGDERDPCGERRVEKRTRADARNETAP